MIWLVIYTAQDLYSVSLHQIPKGLPPLHVLSFLCLIPLGRGAPLDLAIGEGAAATRCSGGWDPIGGDISALARLASWSCFPMAQLVLCALGQRGVTRPRVAQARRLSLHRGVDEQNMPCMSIDRVYTPYLVQDWSTLQGFSTDKNLLFFLSPFD